jgi:hypothetical protein
MTIVSSRRARRAFTITAPMVLALAQHAALAQTTAPADEPMLLPPNARAGECYARVWVPEVYETRMEEVLVHEAYETVEIVPPVYETVAERVLVKEATTRLEVVPARYETVEEQVLVKPAEIRYEVAAPAFTTVEEDVLLKEAYTTWEIGRGPIEKIDTATGEIMCRVEVPAEYTTVEQTVVDTPVAVREVEAPAEYVTVEKQVVVEPARAVEVKVPAEYRTVDVQKLVTPAREVRTEVPAAYDRVERTVKVSDGRLEWRTILCETNTTPDVIRELQTALRDAGYRAGPIDGSLGYMTLQAVEAFQRDHDLPTGQLTMETLYELGVMPRPSTT